MSYWYYNYNYRKARRPKKTSTTPVQRKKFGQTFWGQQWLNSLKGIDYSNRLPRGSAYANNGSVLNHEISGNKISAKVQGSMPKPYNVTVEVPVFTQSEKEKLTGILTSNPAWLAGLLNRQLPQELLAEAQKYNIKIFPSAWSDFKMNCSCPDWAVPCKHLAAVIYILSSEIDLNPMLVLNLHELDILAELKKKKIDVSKDIQEELPSLSSGVKFQKKNLLPEADKSRQSAVGSPQSAVHTQEINFSDLDYSHLPETGASLLNLLSEETPFYHKNAKNELLSFFNSVKRDIKRVHSDISDLKAEHLRTCIDARIYIPRKEIRPHIKLVFENEIKNYDLGELSAWMLKIDLPDTLNWCYPMKTMYEMINFSSRLISSGNTIPQLVTHNNTARFIWFPLIQNQTVKQILDKFNMAFPSHALLFEGEKPEETGFPEITNSGLICALFITSFIRVMNEDEHKKGKSDVLLSAFSGFDSELLSDSSVANAMQLWLKKLHVAKSRFTPVLQVEDKYPEFRVSLLIDDKERTDTPPVIFKNFSEDKRYQDEKMGVLKNLMLLGNHFKQLSELVNNTKKKYLSYSTNEFTTLLFGMLPVMKLLGVEVLLPKNMAKVTAPKLSLMIKNKSGEKPRSFLDLYEMLGFDWQIAVGDMLMDKEEFFKLLGNFTGLVKLKDRFVMLSPEELEKLKKQLSNPPHPDHNDTVRALLSEDYDGAPLGIDPKLTKLIKQWTGPGKESLPEELNATLRPYQVRGYEWLYKNSKLGIGSILADDMGLGKTLQAIAFMLKLKQNGELQKKKALVIAPTTLLTNWAREIDKFTGSLSHFIYHGQKRNSDEFSGYDVILTSYGMLRSDLAILEKMKWQIIIIDEAQNIKNSEAQQTKALKKIAAPVRIALSGTPVENRLGEYWSIMDFTNKGLLGNATFFSKHYANPIQTEHDRQKLESFRKITAPFIMRRLKSDKSIISDLPDKIENNVVASLTKQQAALYSSVVNECMEQIETSDGIQRRGMVLKMMTALKQIGNHPAQYLKNNKFNAEESGKLQLLFDLVEPMLETGEKLLLFTQYKEMGDILFKALEEKFHSAPLFLHGELSRKKRDDMVNAFQNYKHNNIFILSLKAGGTGLNLTAATNVIHYDLWWNPAVENQATDRAYRIGQHKNVMVYRLINKGTLEERIDDMIRSKKQLAEMTVNTGEKWLGDLSNNELKDIVALSKEQ